MHTFVKICGIREPGILAEVPSGGAAGFVVGVEENPRSLTPDQVGELVGQLPNGAEAWAVVADPSPELVHQLFDEAGVDRIQVYGAVPAGLEFLEIHHLVPSLPVPLRGVAGPDPKVPPAEDYSRLHLDAAGEGGKNGSPAVADWEVAHRLVESNPGRKLTLAGGLTPENVGQALAEVGPWGVDVSVGVESAPGVKDVAKLRAFLQAIEAYEQATHGPG